MTSYAAFQTHYLESVWRTGDAALTAELPVLIAEAERRISRDLRVIGLTNQTTLVGVTANEIDLPADYEQARVVRINDNLARPADASWVRQLAYEQGQYGGTSGPAAYTVYATTADKLIFPGDFSVDNTGTVFLDYYIKVPPYATHVSGDSFYDKYPDLYKAALGVCVGEFLMDDAMEVKNEARYTDRINKLEEESIRKEFAGSPIEVQLPGVVK